MRELLKSIYDYPEAFIGLSLVSLVGLYFTYMLFESIANMILTRKSK